MSSCRRSARCRPETVWASGHGGVILRTVDGGEPVGTGGVRRPADSLQFRDIHGFSSRTAIALTSGTGPASRIYRTADGGEIVDARPS